MKLAVHHERQQQEGLVDRSGLQKCGQSELAHIVFQFPHGALEALHRVVDGRKIQLCTFNQSGAGFQRMGLGIGAHECAQANSLRRHL